jgi:rhodanese-related sulfurtransferase
MRLILRESAAVLALATGVALVANGVSPAGIPVMRPLALTDLDPRYITDEEAKARHEAGRSIFVDARKPAEFGRGHVLGALNLPVESFPESFARTSGALPRETEIVVYCGGSDCSESRDLANRLQEVGYARERLKVFRGGWRAWKARGWPAE